MFVILAKQQDLIPADNFRISPLSSKFLAPADIKMQC